MTGNHVGFEFLTESFGKTNRVDENGGLGDAGFFEVFVGAFEHEIGDSETEDFVGLFHHGADAFVAVVVVFAHSYELGALTGKYVCVH